MIYTTIVIAKDNSIHDLRNGGFPRNEFPKNAMTVPISLVDGTKADTNRHHNLPLPSGPIPGSQDRT
jgi:hypothetical protein